MNLLFSKKGELQSLVFAALMSAINIIFVALTNWIVFLVFLLIFILPLGSALVSATCKKKYILVYLIVSFLPCCFINLGDSLFYLMPALLTGVVFGLFINYKSSTGISLALGILIQTLLTYLGILIYWGLFHRDITMDIARLFNLQDFTYFELIKHATIFSISTIQVILCYFVCRNEIKKLQSKTIEISIPSFITPSLSILFIALSIGFAFFMYPLGIDFMMMSFVLTIYLLIKELKKQNIFVYIESGVLVFLTILFVAIFYRMLEFPYSLFLFNIMSVLIVIAFFINNYLLTIPSKDTINS